MNKKQISWILRASNLVNPEIVSDGGGLYSDVYVMTVEDAETIAERIMELDEPYELPTEEEIATVLDNFTYNTFKIRPPLYSDDRTDANEFQEWQLNLAKAITNLLKR